MAKKHILIILVLLSAVAGMIYLVSSEVFFRMAVPQNDIVAISDGADLRNILPDGFGGPGYKELSFDNGQEQSVWLPLCHEAVFGIDDAQDVCAGFKRGYSREYGRSKVFINEYETAAAAVNAASFLVIDANMPTNDVDGVKIIGDDISFALVSGKYLISAKDVNAAELISNIKE